MTAAHATYDGENAPLAAALAAFTPATRRLALRRLAHARNSVETSGDTAAVDHVVRSILMTSAVESIPGYAAAVRRPASLTAMATAATPVAEVVARLEAHDRDQAT